MAGYQKQAPKGVRLKWAPLKEARSIRFSRDSVQGTWVVPSPETDRLEHPSDNNKHSLKGSSNKNYLIP